MNNNVLKNDLSNYNSGAYKKPSVTVDIVICSIINNDLMVLLIKRKNPPFKDYWAIPGGFVDIDRKETLEQTAQRELQEETNLKNIYLEQLKSYGDPDRDPRMRIITVAYFALIPWNEFSDQTIQAGDDAKDTCWFSIRNLPKDLAFDHVMILNDALNRLIGKISYSPIAFNFLPKKFTWTELQNVYEIVLGEKLITSNFRRKICSLYQITELKARKQMKKQGRPATYLIFEKVKETYMKKD